MAQAMRLKADAKAHAEILRLLDDYLAAAAAPRGPPSGSGQRKTNTSDRGSRCSSIPSSRPRTGDSTSIDYPTPGAYLDHGAILLLRNAFELFQRDDLLSDLLAHLRKRPTTRRATPRRRSTPGSS